MTLNITLIFVAVFTLFQVIITNLVGYARIKNEVHFYDDGDIDLRRRQRAHANFTETVPITLLAMAGAEILGSAPIFLWLGGLTLLIGRLWHYYVIRTVGWSHGRAASMVLTFAAMVGFALAILWQTFG